MHFGYFKVEGQKTPLDRMTPKHAYFHAFLPEEACTRRGFAHLAWLCCSNRRHRFSGYDPQPS